MTSRPRRSAGFALWLMLALTAPATGEDFEIAILVSEKWPGAVEIDLPTLRRIYLGRQTEWSGIRVQPVHLAADSETRALFERVVLERAAVELERYWIEQALRGGPLPPLERLDGAAACRTIRSRPGWIGYARVGGVPAADLEGTRVLAVSGPGPPLRPGDPGYPLRAKPGGP